MMFLTVGNLTVTVPDEAEQSQENTTDTGEVQTVPGESQETETGLTEYQERMLAYQQVSTETITRIYFLMVFIAAFLVFDFVYRLIRYNVTNHL